MFELFDEVKGDLFKVLGAVFLAFFTYNFFLIFSEFLGIDPSHFLSNPVFLVVIFCGLAVWLSISALMRLAREQKTFNEYFSRVLLFAFLGVLLFPFSALLIGDTTAGVVTTILGVNVDANDPDREACMDYHDDYGTRVSGCYGACLLGSQRVNTVTSWLWDYFVIFLAVALLVALVIWRFFKPKQKARKKR